MFTFVICACAVRRGQVSLLISTPRDLDLLSTLVSSDNSSEQLSGDVHKLAVLKVGRTSIPDLLSKNWLL